MSQLLPTFSGAIIPIGIQIVVVLSLCWNLVHTINYDMHGEWDWITLLRSKGLFGWVFLPLSMLGSFMGQGHHWIRTLPSMLGSSPAPAPKALSIWAKIAQRASGLFVKKAVEPVRSTGATWALKNMDKLGIPHAAKITEFVSEHHIQLLILLLLIVILALVVIITILMSNSSKKDWEINSLRSEVHKNDKKALLVSLHKRMAILESRQGPLEGSVGLLAEVTERHAAQLAPVVINIDPKKPALARDLDLVCVATPFVPGYGTGRSSEAANSCTTHFQDMMHRLLCLRDETPWDAMCARAQE